MEIMGGGWLSSQDSIYLSKKTMALRFLDDRNYEQALSQYRDLLYRFPKEPEYLYGAGICLTLLNRDPEEALIMLRSVNLSAFNPLSWYYTGLLEHHNYLFDDAIKTYSKFTLLGKSSDIKSLGVTRLIEMARNGLEFTHNALNLKVMDANPIHPGQIEKVAEINGSGKLVKKPVEFFSKSDIREEYRPMVYLPVYTEMNDYVYVSGYDKQRK
jgi:tetratricopeptide (TPR) repeat protein